MEAEEPTNHKAQNWTLSLVYSSTLLVTLTMQFSLDHKRQSHKQNQCSASDSVGLIFTRLYRSTLLNYDSNYNSVPVKTSLKSTRNNIKTIMINVCLIVFTTNITFYNFLLLTTIAFSKTKLNYIY